VIVESTVTLVYATARYDFASGGNGGLEPRVFKFLWCCGFESLLCELCSSVPSFGHVGRSGRGQRDGGNNTVSANTISVGGWMVLDWELWIASFNGDKSSQLRLQEPHGCNYLLADAARQFAATRNE
jgi:hypothetical protein